MSVSLSLSGNGIGNVLSNASNACFSRPTGGSLKRRGFLRHLDFFADSFFIFLRIYGGGHLVATKTFENYNSAKTQHFLEMFLESFFLTNSYHISKIFLKYIIWFIFYACSKLVTFFNFHTKTYKKRVFGNL